MADNIHTTTVVDANAWDQLMQMDAPANSPVATTVAGVAPIQTWSEMEQVLPDIGDVDNKILAAAGFSNTILISTTTAEVLETITVSIGENGNWFVGTEDTGVPAVGTDATTMPKASGLYTAAALTQVGTQVTLKAGTEYCVKVGASYGSFKVLADTLITLSASTMILTIDNAGAIRQYPLGTNANIIPPSEALVGIAMSGSGGTAKFEAPTVHQAWIVASLAKPFSELAQQAAINANLSAVNAQEAADSAAQSEIIVSQNVSIAQEWAESPEDDPISTSPFSFSALHWAMKSQKFAQVAGSGLVWYGGWNASGNLAPPTPAAGSGAPFYRITGAGTINTVAYAIGDYIHWDTIGLQWFKIDGTDSVVSVNGKSGVVSLVAADVGALPISGGALTGPLSIDTVQGVSPILNLFGTPTPTGTNARGIHLWNPAKTARIAGMGTFASAGVEQFAWMGFGPSPWDTGLQVYSGTDVRLNGHEIYHDANKPTTAEVTGISAFGQTLIDDADAPAARATLKAPVDETGNLVNMDLNTLVKSGFYRLGSGVLNGPINASYGLVIVIRAPVTDTIAQILVDYSTSRTWVRSGNPTEVGGVGVYKPWREVYHQGSILGSVSQASGVPTGAIIERGSNANGEYTKYADGTLECWRPVTLTFKVSTVLEFNWTLPAPHVTGMGVGILCGQSYDSGVNKLNRASATAQAVGSGALTSTVLRFWATGTDTFSAGDQVGNAPAFFKGRWY